MFPGLHHGTSADRILLVGAHWDTTAFTDGYNDNGSGELENELKGGRRRKLCPQALLR